MVALWLLAYCAAEDKPLLHQGAVFAGQYMCGSPAWLMLHIEMADAPAVTAAFHFIYPTTSQTGAFAMSGTISNENILRLQPGEWLQKPPGKKVIPVGLAGIVSDDGTRIKGEVMHLGCGSFDVNRTVVDVSPGTLTLSADGTTAAPRGLDLELSSEGPITDANPSRTTLQLLVNALAQIAGEAGRSHGDGRSDEEVNTEASADGGSAYKGPFVPGRAPRFSIWEVPESFEEGSGAENTRRQEVMGMLQQRRWREAYTTWQQLAWHTQQSAAHGLVGGLVAIKDTLIGGADAEASRQLQHDALRVLSVLTGVTQASGAIAALLQSTDPHLTAFADEQLQLNLNRSGAVEPDALLHQAEELLRDGGAAGKASEKETNHAARGALERLRASAPHWAHGAYRLGLLSATTGDLGECVALQRRALELNRYHLPAMLQLGLCLKDLRDTAGALSIFTELQRRHPSMPGIRRLKQWIYSATEQAKLAK